MMQMLKYWQEFPAACGTNQSLMSYATSGHQFLQLSLISLQASPSHQSMSDESSRAF